MTVSVITGDCLEIMPTLPAESFDAIVTDTPYHLTTGKKGGSGPASVNLNTPHGRARVTTGFMGMKWDGGDVAFRPETWSAALRLLKPGGHLLAFGGARTYHRLACAIEDGGFEIRDQIGWLYGSGFPKSRNLDGEWDGWGTALKPAWEPIVLARKPLVGTVAENVAAHGCGALNIDGCRIATEESLNGGAYAESGGRTVSPSMHAGTGMNVPGKTCERPFEQPLGRWPANVCHDGSVEVVERFPAEAGGRDARVGMQSGQRPGGFGNVGADIGDGAPNGALYGDSGSAARFFATFQQEDECHNQSNAGTAAPSLSLQSALGASVQSAAAIWPSLAGIVSSEPAGRFIPVTPSESRTIRELVITATAPIGSESSRESLHEKHTQSGSHVSVAALRRPTGTTTITASLSKSDGSVDRATFSITPTNLDRGEAAYRFKYCAKASREDRDEGLDGFEKRALLWSSGTQNPGSFQSPNTDRNVRNFHPTVKPTALMRWLCRLVTPPGGNVLDMFAGSGSTGKACELEGFDCVLIEGEPDYIPIIHARLQHAREERRRATAQQSLFTDVRATA